jgi:hypothetical protein
MRPLKLITAAVTGATLLVAMAGVASAGVSGPAIYVDGTVYRTVGTPTDFSGTGAPLHSFDVIYDFDGLQMNVATAAPGDKDFNGGRWMVHALSFTDYDAAVADEDVDLNGNGVLDSDAEVAAAIDKGYATDMGVVKQFECPLIKLPHGPKN